MRALGTIFLIAYAFMFGTIYASGDAYGSCADPAKLDFHAYLTNYGEYNGE